MIEYIDTMKGLTGNVSKLRNTVNEHISMIKQSQSKHISLEMLKKDNR